MSGEDKTQKSVSLDNIEIAQILEKKFDNVSFIIDWNKMESHLQKLPESIYNHIICFKDGGHCQAIFLNKEKNNFFIAIFDSFGIAINGSRAVKTVKNFYEKLNGFNLDIIVSQNQRQGKHSGCAGFAISDIEMIQRIPNLTSLLKEHNFICPKQQDGFKYFILPPEFMEFTQKLGQLPEYIENITKLGVSASRIDILKLSVDRYLTDSNPSLVGCEESKKHNSRNDSYINDLKKLIMEVREDQEGRPCASVLTRVPRSKNLPALLSSHSVQQGAANNKGGCIIL